MYIRITNQSFLIVHFAPECVVHFTAELIVQFAQNNHL
jgi:hypothetical protein